jgi:hypothetical protein
MFPNIAEPGLHHQFKIHPEVCPLCGVTKYGVYKRGYIHMYRESLLNDTDIQMTNEWFGSGTKTGFRQILISNRFAKVILDEKWLGIVLQPIKLI